MKQEDLNRLKEIWVDVKGYEGLYKISNKGRVLGIKQNKIKKFCKLNSGYYAVGLSKNSKSKTFSVHRLVLENFTNSNTWKEQVNHKDLNKLNNNLHNLEWCTRSQNNKHSYDFGERKRIYGSKIGSSKLNELDIPLIRSMNKTLSMREIGRRFNVSHKCISAIIKKESWNHV